MNASHLKTATVGNERVKSFVVPHPDDLKRSIVVTVNEMVDTGHVEVAVAASEQAHANANHRRFVDIHLSDAG